MLRFVCLLLAAGAVCSSRAFAWDTSWNKDTGTNNVFQYNGTSYDHWDVWLPNNNTADGYFTNSVNAGTNNVMVIDANWQNDPRLVISNTVGSAGGINEVLITAGTTRWRDVILGQNGAVTITNATLEISSMGGLWGAGSLLTLNDGGYLRTQGRLEIYGTLLGNNGTFDGYGDSSQAVKIGSGGQVVAESGTLFFNTRNAFDLGGLQIDAGGLLQVDSGATFMLSRYAGAGEAWLSGGSPVNNGTILLDGGTVTSADGTTQNVTRQWINNGVIIGSGTLATSIGQSGTGQTIASNGTLNVFGTFASGQATFTSVGGSFGTLAAASGGNLQLAGNVGSNVTANWAVNEGGTLTVGSGVTFTNGGTLTLAGGVLTNLGTFVNASITSGRGTIDGTPASNLGGLLASNGTLFVRLDSATNAAVATVGTLSTNAVLDLQLPGAAGGFVNQGTIAMSGGTLQFDGSATGIITNTATGTITGVGDLTARTVVNSGAILAANPVGALSLFSVALSDLDSPTATLGAASNATLNLLISGGGGTAFANNGTIAMSGGSLVISNGAPGLITNNFLVAGHGTVAAALWNQSNVVAQVAGGAGTLTVSLQGGTNSSLGYLRAGQDATLVVSNGLLNLGTIGADGLAGGAIQVGLTAAGVLTNRGTIAGNNPNAPLSFRSFVRNDDGGLILATNGTLVFAAVDGLFNTNATIRADSGGVVRADSSNAWVNAGLVDLRGGTLRTGGATNADAGESFTNAAAGTISGFGTVIGGGAYGGASTGYDKALVNAGSVIATNPYGTAAQTLYLTSGEATTNNGIQNIGTFVVATNQTLSLNRAGLFPIVNLGTVTLQYGSLTGSGGVLSNATDGLGHAGLIAGSGTVTFPLANLAGATVRATNGVLLFTSTAAPVNLGTLAVHGPATLTFNSGATWQNQGAVELWGGTLRTGGEPFTNAGTATIAGYGTLIGGGSNGLSGAGIDKAIVNSGTIIVTNSAGAAPQTLTIDTGMAMLNDGFLNRGTIDVGPGHTLSFVRSNTLASVNDGTITLHGGTLTASGGLLTNLATGGRLLGGGTVVPRVVNQGTILATAAGTPLYIGGDRFDNLGGATVGAQQGTLVVGGLFTNAGTVRFDNSYGTFSNRVVNQGAWILDPSTNIWLSDYELSPTGTITMDQGSLIAFKSNFVNFSAQSNLYNTLSGKFLFDGAGGHTQQLLVAGLNLGGATSSLGPTNELFFSNAFGSFSTNQFSFHTYDPIWGFTNNFALGELELGSLTVTSAVLLADSFFDANQAGLYLDSLTLNPGSLLIVSNDVAVYFRATNGITGISFDPNNLGGANVLLLDGGSFHQIAVIPEPSQLFLMALGALTAWRWHRRRRGRQ